MKKIIIFFISFNLLFFAACSCTVFKRPLDNNIQFSKQLTETESYIRKGEWENARNSLKNTQKTWKKIKPFLQIDIDHDYVNDIENNFTKLRAYLETKDKSNSYATIILIQQLWHDIGQM